MYELFFKKIFTYFLSIFIIIKKQIGDNNEIKKIIVILFSIAFVIFNCKIFSYFH